MSNIDINTEATLFALALAGQPWEVWQEKYRWNTGILEIDPENSEAIAACFAIEMEAQCQPELYPLIFEDKSLTELWLKELDQEDKAA